MNLIEKRDSIERQCEYLERMARFARHQLKNFDERMEDAKEAEAAGLVCTVTYKHRGANIHLLRASEDVDRIWGLSDQVKEGLTDKVEPVYPDDGPCNITLYRAPCLMEDEGRHFESGVFTHWGHAREILDVLTDNGTGYFRYSNYYYVSKDTPPLDWPMACVRGVTPTRVC